MRGLAAAALFCAITTLAAPVRGQEQPEYRIGPGDRLDITVFGQKDLSGKVVVDGSGRISFPLLGLIDADNKTIAELQAQITVALDRDFIVNPRVSIEVVNYRPFFILGQVNKPGSYSYIEGMTVRMAVALAGGFTRRARESSVVVIRAHDPEQQRRESKLDAAVLPGDTIEVERRLF
ncbi:MAG: polysaccharide biosynthesis/export family protein [Alphaproteobacteria bacterium]